jgi:hypothetical protein
MMTRFIVRKSMNALKKVQKKMKIENNYIFFSPGHKPCEPLTTLCHKPCEPLATLSHKPCEPLTTLSPYFPSVVIFSHFNLIFWKYWKVGTNLHSNLYLIFYDTKFFNKSSLPSVRYRLMIKILIILINETTSVVKWLVYLPEVR